MNTSTSIVGGLYIVQWFAPRGIWEVGVLAVKGLILTFSKQVFNHCDV